MDTGLILIIILILIVIYNNNNPLFGDKIKTFYTQIYNAILELITPPQQKTQQQMQQSSN